ncbi:MAG: HRDC domain-containing protein [Actinomycetaceae bacterium]|nr:HRDC domain-containing protein [Actinomycetaceae bacterium]
MTTVKLVTVPREGTPKPLASHEELTRLAQRIRAGRGPIACDVERGHGFTYSTRAYLIQIKREGVGIGLIDPTVSTAGMAKIAHCLSGADYVLHAADQDLESLRGEGIEPASLFDTEIAALVLGYDHVGLAALTESLLGIKLAKEHQAANWSRRPLPEEWCAYAALDVDYLLELAAILSDKLQAANRYEWALQENAHVLAAPPRRPKPDPWRIKGAGRLASRRKLAVLRQLWLAREEIGRAENISPSRLLSKSALLSIADSLVDDPRRLTHVRELSYRRSRRYLPQWRAAIAQAKALPQEELPALHRPLEEGELPAPREWRRVNPEAAARLRLVKDVIAAAAHDLGIRADILLGARVQQRLAWEWPMDIEATLTEWGARPWQCQIVLPILRPLVED